MKKLFVDIFFFSFTRKYANIAMEKSRENIKKIDELSLLERILQIENENTSNLAAVLALDLFLVGIDTVIITMNNN